MVGVRTGRAWLKPGREPFHRAKTGIGFLPSLYNKSVEARLSDGDLVRQAQAGESAAYGELVCRYSARIPAFCHSRAGRAGLGEDLAQETLLRGFRSLPTLEDPAKFGSWLCGIAVRTFIDWQRGKQSSQVSLAELDSNSEETLEGRVLAEHPEKEEERRRILAAVEALPESFRETLMLFYYEEMSYQEIADLLGLSAAAVNARLTRGRAVLRERLSRSRS